MGLIEDLYAGYAKVNPRDFRDTEVHISKVTADALWGWIDAQRGSSREDRPFESYTLLGLKCRIDDSLSFGVFKFITENEHERAMRRITQDGGIVNVVKMGGGFRLPVMIQKPKPTLRALLRYWFRRLS